MVKVVLVDIEKELICFHDMPTGTSDWRVIAKTIKCKYFESLEVTSKYACYCDEDARHLRKKARVFNIFRLKGRLLFFRKGESYDGSEESFQDMTDEDLEEVITNIQF